MLVRTRVQPSMATIYMTTNGGTVWTSVNVMPYVWSDLDGASASEVSAMVAMTAPGALLGVSASSSGQYFYAVGTAPETADAATGSFTEASYGTILMSANGGATWHAHRAAAAAAAAAAHGHREVPTG